MSAQPSSAPDELNGTLESCAASTESVSQFTKVKSRAHVFDRNSHHSSYFQSGLKLIIEASRVGSSLPCGAARDAYSAYPAYAKVIENQSGKILNIIQSVLKARNVRGNIARRDDDEKMEMLLECNDIMLESINSNLDEVAGIKKVPELVLVESEFRPAPEHNRGRLNGSWNENAHSHLANLTKKAKLLTAKNILRPQLNFKVPVDNSNTPFEPRITDKPNSLKPLAVLPEYDEQGNVEAFLHPYEFELNKFEPAMELLCKVEVEPSGPLESTPFTVIAEESALTEMIGELRKVKEIAVDLEHHSYRTFQGITCLMQVSTRDRDYVIDTIALREELHVINEVFTDRRIVKVFHGADSDIEWMQRDLGLYIVNLFDTHQAAKRLNFARLSLAFLLKHFCNVDADKSFQLADWRIRPLPEELLSYARQDTHYLLYIYDLMRNELLKLGNGESHLLKAVYQAGVELCKKRYTKARLFDDSHMDVYRRSKKIFDNRQMYALQHLYAWRDEIARLEDESTGYVLPNHMLMHISENLPREMQGVLACCNPVPPLVRQNLQQIHQILLKAREQPLVSKVAFQKATTTPASTTPAISSVNQFLYCPHDLTHDSDFRDDLPTLLGSKNRSAGAFSSPLKRTYSKISLLEDEGEEEQEVDNKKLTTLKDIKFITPYSRFLSILPVAEEQERLDNARAAEEAKKKKLCPTAKEMEQSLKRKIAEENVKEEQVEKAGNDAKEPPQKKKKWMKEKVQSFKQMIAGQSRSAETSSNPDTTTTTKTPKKLSKQQKWKAKQNRFDSPNQKAGSSTSGGGQQEKNGESSKGKDFDYSKVDYSKFQGGSKQAQQGGRNQFDSKFRSRGQKAKNADKKFNKMFSFSKMAHNK